MFYKITAVAFISLSILGCATDFRDYEGSTGRAALANLCERHGLISSDDFAHYSDLQMGWGPRQNMTIVDENKMRSMYLSKVESSNKVVIESPRDKEDFKLRCAQVSVVAARVRAQSSAPSQSVPAYTLPKTTNCMTTYGYTRCSSF